VLKRLEELIDNEEAWNILVECGTGVGLGLSKWLAQCGNTSGRYVSCTNVCTHVCLGFVFVCWGLCVLMYANV